MGPLYQDQYQVGNLGVLDGTMQGRTNERRGPM